MGSSDSGGRRRAAELWARAGDNARRQEEDDELAEEGRGHEKRLAPSVEGEAHQGNGADQRDAEAWYVGEQGDDVASAVPGRCPGGDEGADGLVFESERPDVREDAGDKESEADHRRSQ